MIALFASGSGGHIEPAILLTRRLKDRGKDVDLILGNRYPKVSDVKVVNIPRRKILAVFYFPFLCIYGIGYFLHRRPKIVVGFGGFQFLPLLIIFRILGCKLCIYEPNLIMGRANRFLLPFAHQIFLIWEETSYKIPPLYRRKVSIIQPLISDSDISFLGQEKFNIVISGGSQGSQFLNHLAIQFLQTPGPLQNVRVDLITGEKFYSRVMEQLLHIETDVEFYIHAFCNDMGRYYTRGDIFITRAGAQTILELIFYCRPAILIPYPYAGGHQLKNAEYLRGKKGCFVIHQKDARWETVRKLIFSLNKNRTILEKMSSNLNRLKQKLFTRPGMEEIIVSKFC